MPTSTADSDLAQLLAIANEFTVAFEHADVDRVMRFYGDTYVDVNLRKSAQSHAERRHYYSHLMNLGLRVAVVTDEVMIEGNIAIIRGRIDVRDPRLTDLPVRELRYLEVARKQPSGAWKVVWGMDGPVQEWNPESVAN